MVESATQYRKNGFNDEDSAQLAKISAMFSNVADETISAADAADFIISQLIAFNQVGESTAENAQHIVDSVNEVANSFSVSSGDLSQGLSVVASSSAAMGNSLEETIGLMTAITEQTRNASKASRGLNTIMSRLASVLDESSSNGKAIKQIYADLGESMTDTNGQLLSGYELLEILADNWDKFDGNTQKYIATTVAGTTQLNNFLALMNNFEHATKATETAINSQGSALKENERYMESLKAKASSLKATFQDLANNVIDNELVGAFLSLANGALSVLDTDLGVFVTQWGLMTGVLTGGITIIGEIASKLTAGVKAFSTLTTAMNDTAMAAGILSSAAFPVAAIIAGVVAAGYGVYKLVQKSNPSLDEINDKIDGLDSSLQSNKDRLEEINNLPWNERTQEILDEKAALEAENEELEKQIKHYSELRKEKAQQKLDKGLELTEIGGGTRYRATDTTGGSFLIAEGEDIEKYKRYGYTIDEIAKTAEYAGDALKNKLALNVEYLTKATENGTIAQNQWAGVIYDETISALTELAEIDDYYAGLLEQLNAGVQTNTEEQLENASATTDTVSALQQATTAYEEMASGLEGISDAYDVLTSAVEQYNEYGSISYDTLNKLLALDSEYLNMLELKDGKLQLNTEALMNNAKQAQEAAVQARVQALAEEILAIALGETETQTNDTDDAANTHINTMTTWLEKSVGITNAAFNLADAVGAVNSALRGAGVDVGSDTESKISTAVANARKDIELLRSFKIGDYSSSGSKSKAKSSAKSTTDAYKEAFDEWLDYKDHQLAMDEITEEEYYKALKEKNEEYFAGKEQYLDEYRKYAEKVYEWEKKQAEEAAEAAKEAYENYLDDIGDKINAVISYVTEFSSRQIDKLEEQISAIDEEIDAVNNKYDDKLDALEEQNDAIEKQIQLEQYLEALAKAKSTQQMVFKDGQFQYVSDPDAISSAQSDLNAFNRQQALEQQKSQIEEQRNAELKQLENSKSALEAEKSRWEEYKDGWSNLTSEYEYQQNELIAQQLLGIDLENANWDTRLNNFDNFNQMYSGYQDLLLQSQQYTADAEASVWNERLAAACDFMNQMAAILGTGATYSYTPVGGSGASTGTSKFGAGTTSNVSYPNTELGIANGAAGWREGIDYGTQLAEAMAEGADIGTLQAIMALRDAKIADLGLGGSVESTEDMWKRLKEKYGYANGTLSARGGLSLVGENGPEMRVLSQGDGILPADVTRNLWSFGKNPTGFMKSVGSSTVLNISNISLPSVRNAQQLVEGLKELAIQRVYSN